LVNIIYAPFWLLFALPMNFLQLQLGAYHTFFCLNLFGISIEFATRQYMLITDPQDPDQYPRFRRALLVQLINVLLNRALLFVPLVMHCIVRLRSVDNVSANIFMGPALLMIIANVLVLVDVMKQSMAWLSCNAKKGRPLRESAAAPSHHDFDDAPSPPRPTAGKDAPVGGSKTRKPRARARDQPSQKYQATPRGDDEKKAKDAIRFGRTRKATTKPCAAASSADLPQKGRSCADSRRVDGESSNSLPEGEMHDDGEDDAGSDASDVTFGGEPDDDVPIGVDEWDDVDYDERGERMRRAAEEIKNQEAELADAWVKEKERQEQEQKRQRDRERRREAEREAQARRASDASRARRSSRRDAEKGSGEPPAVDHSKIFSFGRAAKGTYYEMLGVWPDTNDSDLKRAFHRLSKKWHPDKNPDSVMEAEIVFKGIKAAYETLVDPDKRRRYDKSLRSGGH